MNKIGVFSFGRKQSNRCPNKMLRPFAGTTLTDIVLSKLASIGEGDIPAYFGGYEEEFKVKCEEHNVHFVQRDYESAVAEGPITEVLSFLKHVDCEYMLLISGCTPFSRVETIQSFLQECVSDGYRPAISATKRRKHFMRSSGQAINFDPDFKTPNTKLVEPICELVDMCYFFNRDYFFEHGTYWDWHNLKLIEVDGAVDVIDIDMEEDFWLAEQVWKARSKSS